MLTLDEARKIQAKREKSAIIRFAAWLVVIIAVTITVYLLFDYFQKYIVLYLVPAVCVFLNIRKSKIYFFLFPKEYSGNIKYCKLYIRIEKAVLSHQPGVG